MVFVVVDVANAVVVVVAVPYNVVVFATDVTIVALFQIFHRVSQNKYYLKHLVVLQEKSNNLCTLLRK
jgi:hypothetical protein